MLPVRVGLAVRVGLTVTVATAVTVGQMSKNTPQQPILENAFPIILKKHYPEEGKPETVVSKQFVEKKISNNS